MKPEVKILLLGFPPFEKSTFESFFKLVGRRDTLYQVVPDANDAHILVVNGDNPTAQQWVGTSLKASQKAMFIGAADPRGQWPTVPRPIKLTAVFGLVEALAHGAISADASIQPPTQNRLAASAVSPAAAPVSATPKPLPAAVLAPPAVAKGKVRQGSGTRGVSTFGASNFMGITGSAESKFSADHFDDILVVDDSDVALKFMQNRLTRYGFRTHLARSGEEALTLVSSKRYKFVFLDVMMDGLDGYQTCRAIKQRKDPLARPPVVVMLTSRGGSIDKIRGGLAGCDGFLTKPLNEVELLKILSKHDEQVERSFRDTNYAGSSVLSAGSR